MTQSDSSLISALEYDDKAEVLTIVFRSTNEVRHYTGFPPEIFWEFEESPSKGKFFNSKIKHQFEVLKSGKVSDEQLASALAATPVDIVLDGISKMQVPDVQPLPERDDLGINEADIRSADPEHVTSPVLDENLLPAEEEALAQPAKKQPQVDKLLSQWNALVPATPQPLAIRDKGHYVEVAERLKKKVGIRDFVFSILDPTRDLVYKAYKSVQDRQKGLLDPMDASITADKRVLNAWNTEQERIAREAQQKAQREAEEAAAKEQARATEELRIQIAEEQAQAGDMEQAELTLSDTTIQAAPVAVYAPRVQVETPVIAGMTSRKAWKAELISLELLVLDVAEGIKHMKEKGSLGGHAPLNVLEAKMPALNQLAKANESEILFPGVRGFNDAGLSVRREK